MVLQHVARGARGVVVASAGTDAARLEDVDIDGLIVKVDDEARIEFSKSAIASVVNKTDEKTQDKPVDKIADKSAESAPSADGKK